MLGSHSTLNQQDITQTAHYTFGIRTRRRPTEQTMSRHFDDVSEWNMGDAVREKDSDRVGKVSELGIGECLYLRKPNGEIEYENQGDGRVCLTFVEPSTKIRRAKKWVVVLGTRESFWIDKLSTEFENESYLVRKTYAEREMEEARNERWPSPIAMGENERVYDSAEEFGSIDNNDNQNQNNSNDGNSTEDEDDAVNISAFSGASVAIYHSKINPRLNRYGFQHSRCL